MKLFRRNKIKKEIPQEKEIEPVIQEQKVIPIQEKVNTIGTSQEKEQVPEEKITTNPSNIVNEIKNNVTEVKPKKKQSLLILFYTYFDPAPPNLNPSSSFLLEVPHDITREILLYLSVRDIGRVAQTCKALNQATREGRLWKELAKRDYKLVTAPQGLKTRSWHDIYKIQKTGKFFPREFFERSWPQRIGIILLTFIFLPFIILYLTPKICRATWRYVLYPSIRQFHRTLTIKLPRLFRKSNGTFTKFKNVILPNFYRNQIIPRWNYFWKPFETYVLRPLVTLVKRIFDFIFLDVPRFILDKIILPLGSAILDLLQMFHKYIVVPLVELLTQIFTFLFITIPKFIYHKILVPTAIIINNISIWIYHNIVIPILNAIDKTFEFIFITTPKFIYNRIFVPSAVWTYYRIMVPLAKLIKKSLRFTFVTVPQVAYEKLVLPTFYGSQKGSLFLYQRYLKPAGKFFFVTTPLYIYHNLLVPPAKGTQTYVLAPLYKGLMVTKDFLFETAPNFTYNKFIVPTCTAINRGALWMHTNVVKPAAKFLFVTAPNAIYSKVLLPCYNAFKDHIAIPFYNHILIPSLHWLSALLRFIFFKVLPYLFFYIPVGILYFLFVKLPKAIYIYILKPLGYGLKLATIFLYKNILTPVGHSIMKVLRFLAAVTSYLYTTYYVPFRNACVSIFQIISLNVKRFSWFIWQNVKALSQVVYSSSLFVAKTIFAQVKFTAEMLKNLIQSLYQQIANQCKIICQEIVSLLKTAYREVWIPFARITKEILQTIQQSLTQMANATVEFWMNIVKWIKEKFQ